MCVCEREKGEKRERELEEGVGDERLEFKKQFK
jgi:hypothetical protein